MKNKKGLPGTDSVFQELTPSSRNWLRLPGTDSVRENP